MWILQSFFYLFQIITNFLIKYNSRPKQGSTRWFNNRSVTVGGSEIKLFNSNKWKQHIVKFIAKKLGLEVRNYDIIQCIWGNVLESAGERIVEIDLGTKIYGTDCNIPAPMDSPLRGYFANSLDGITIIGMIGDNIVTTTVDDQLKAINGCEAKIVTLEFKNTYSRVPNGKIPSQYIDQVLSGLDVTRIADFGLYIDLVHRKCKLTDLGNNPKFDSDFHYNPRSRLSEKEQHPWENPYAWFYTKIYVPDKIDDLLKYQIRNLKNRFDESAFDNNGLIDFGTSDYFQLKILMSLIDPHKNILKFKHSEPCFADGRGNKLLQTQPGIQESIERDIENTPDGLIFIGYLPFKTFEINYIPVERDPNYLKRIQDRIIYTMDIVKKLRRETIENTRKEFHNWCVENGHAQEEEEEIEEYVPMDCESD